MLKVRDDDAGAFEELVRRYQPRLVRWMQHIAPQPGIAEDLAQETFLRIYRARHNYQPGAKFSTWLFTIAGNVVRNAKRTMSRRHETSEVDAPNPTTEDSMPGSITHVQPDASGLMPTRQVEGDERAKLVRAAIASLGERQRMALVLSRFENMSYVEIAETMDLSTKAVKSLLSRARVALRESLQPYMAEGRLGDSFDGDRSLPSLSQLASSPGKESGDE